MLWSTSHSGRVAELSEHYSQTIVALHRHDGERIASTSVSQYIQRRDSPIPDTQDISLTRATSAGRFMLAGDGEPQPLPEPYHMRLVPFPFIQPESSAGTGR